LPRRIVYVVACCFHRSIAAEGYFFSLDRKEAKSQVSPKASLPHLPLLITPFFAHKIRQNLGLVFIPAEPLKANA